MSAIAGIVRLDASSLQTDSIQRMVDMLAHRGLDGAGVWHDGCVALGHRMLWTTPESLTEKLPLQIGHNTITADARIDNRDELLHQLNFGGRPASEISDSEIILAAYEKWGEDCPGKLIGDFAFAIWDGRQNKLFCARDYFGVKPFYYYHASHRFIAFASEIKGLLCLKDIPHEVNETWIGDFLSVFFEDKAITFYRGILRLPPAHRMIVSDDRIRLEEYWTLNRDHELRLHSEEAYAENYREIFAEAVRCRMRSAFPVGGTLSGGLDSSSIVCMARELRRQEHNDTPFPTFSAIYNEASGSDEQPYIQAVLDQGGYDPHYVHGDQISPLVDLDRQLWHQDGPFFAQSLYIHWAMWSLAEKQGMRIMLDGLNGDQTVSPGIMYLRELAYKWHWRALAREVGYSDIISIMSPRRAWYLYVKHYGIKPRIPSRLMHIYHTARGYKIPEIRPFDTINSDFAAQMKLMERFRSLAESNFRIIYAEREAHFHVLMSGLVPYGFEVMDKCAAAFKIEPRVPFADRRLVEFCLSLPPNQKYKRGHGRLIARRALAGILPESIQWRKDKGNLGPGLYHSLLQFEGQRLKQCADEPILSIKKYINPIRLQKHYERITNQLQKPENDPRPFWAAMILDQSFRLMPWQIFKGVMTAKT